jgi:hypothetical protein
MMNLNIFLFFVLVFFAIIGLMVFSFFFIFLFILKEDKKYQKEIESVNFND